jgi:hypothetical protein
VRAIPGPGATGAKLIQKGAPRVACWFHRAALAVFRGSCVLSQESWVSGHRSSLPAGLGRRQRERSANRPCKGPVGRLESSKWCGRCPAIVANEKLAVLVSQSVVLGTKHSDSKSPRIDLFWSRSERIFSRPTKMAKSGRGIPQPVGFCTSKPEPGLAATTLFSPKLQIPRESLVAIRHEQNDLSPKSRFGAISAPHSQNR